MTDGPRDTRSPASYLSHMRMRIGTLRGLIRRYVDGQDKLATVREAMWFVKIKGKEGWIDGNAYVSAEDEDQAAVRGAEDLKNQGILGASAINVDVEPDQAGDANVRNGAIDISNKFLKTEKKLSARARKKLPKGDFVFPDEERYPIHDKSHARNALSRVSQHGSQSEKKKVRAAVKRRYPDIGQS